MRLIDADALYNGAMKDEYFDYVEHDNHGRESFAYSCAMQRLAEAPTVDAIPVEWLKQQRERNDPESVKDINGAFVSICIDGVLVLWQKEQEAR